MTRDSGLTVHKGAAALIAVASLVTGAAASYLLMRSGAPDSDHAAVMPSGAAPGSSSAPDAPSTSPTAGNAPLPDVVVSLSREAVERAGIVVTPVSGSESAAALRLPGLVEPNAYKQVAVTPLVAGRVTHVSAELGDRVRRGQTLTRIYSPELADAQTKYVSARAMLDAHDRELQRTQKLVEIGAASRQELERIHAEHAAQTAAVQSARSQLALIGVPASTIEALASGASVNATTSVPAPIDGIVTERTANVGLNVDQGTALFTVVDLSTVWIVADVFERDFARVRVGNEATVTTTAYPGLSLRGRISYIDPQVSAETRTAKVRIEVPNPRGELRLGMYADVAVTGVMGASAPLIPQTAVQNVGDRTVVYLANPKEPGKFIERELRLGDKSREQFQVISGVQPGDFVVTEGSFLLRAEVERLGLRPAAASGTPAATAPGSSLESRSAPPDVQSVKILVNERGFEPANVVLRAGAPARLTFLRTTDKTCGTEVVFPSLNMKRTLPLNQPVDIGFTPAKPGELAFACGMNMLRGTIIVQ
jgi:cobalt-zinc-cadmium efflux system membrane fusion protein